MHGPIFDANRSRHRRLTDPYFPQEIGPMFDAFRRLRRSPIWMMTVIVALTSLVGCKPPSAPIPELSSRPLYSKIFVEIDQAEAITDPIERCLSYPSPPHLQWPEQLIKVLCADLFTPVMQAPEIKAMIDRKDWKGLHDHYSGYLERHYSGADPEKLLYRAFPLRSWNSPQEADKYTRKWVAAAPNDPFANTARGAVLVSAAWSARGGGFFRDIPDSHKRQMYKLALEATRHLRKAVVAEPKLLPAYSHLIDAYVLGGKQEWVPTALQAAIRQSPDTFYVRDEAVEYLQQKWGGHPRDMDALIDGSERYIKRNPRLAMIGANRLREPGDQESDRKKYKLALAYYREALALGPDHAALVNAAFVAPKLGYHVEELVYLTQDIRFSKDSRDSLMQRALIWESDGDFKRAMRDYQAAKKLYPLDSEIDKRISAARKREKELVRK
jgi:tetratricopeptide (TPR) repeat protein